MHWYLKALLGFFKFKGRARRKEYWTFMLVNFVITVILTIIEMNFGLDIIYRTIFTYVMIIPSITVGVRRLHDTGRSGKWWFISIVPLIGWAWLLFYYCLDSQKEDNKYGPNPKEVKMVKAS